MGGIHATPVSAGDSPEAVAVVVVARVVDCHPFGDRAYEVFVGPAVGVDASFVNTEVGVPLAV